jgi:hypothetical protein
MAISKGNNRTSARAIRKLPLTSEAVPGMIGTAQRD